MKKISCSLLTLSYRIFVTKVHIFYDGFMNFTIFFKIFSTPICAFTLHANYVMIYFGLKRSERTV